MRYSTLRQFRFTLACLLVASFLPVTASTTHAMTAKALRSVDRELKTHMPVAVRLSYGTLKGVAHELVYTSDGEKMSDLIWKVDTPVAGAQCTIEPAPWLALSIGGWKGIGDEPTTSMEDFDWARTNDEDTWSHWSKSPTDLKKGYMIDANADIIKQISPNATVSFILGFRHDSWKWETYGGEYIYSSANGFRDIAGTLPNEKSITYEQWFYAPYLGLGLGIDRDRFHLRTRIAGSRWAWANDEDHHHLRDNGIGIVFEDTFENIWYLSAGAEITCDITRLISISLAADYQEYEEDGKGNIKEISADGERTFENSAGISHESQMFSISLDFKF